MAKFQFISYGNYVSIGFKIFLSPVLYDTVITVADTGITVADTGITLCIVSVITVAVTGITLCIVSKFF